MEWGNWEVRLYDIHHHSLYAVLSGLSKIQKTILWHEKPATILLLQLTKFTEKGSSWKATSSSASQKILCI